VIQNEPFTFPSSVIAQLTSGGTAQTAVTWNNNSIDTSIIGTQQRIGTSVIDPSKTMTLSVEVTPQTVTGISLNVNQRALNVGNNFQLTETVQPSNAYNKNVSWSSSDPSIASVSATGLSRHKAAA
jgi:uncharacterized protein YjdB